MAVNDGSDGGGDTICCNISRQYNFCVVAIATMYEERDIRQLRGHIQDRLSCVDIYTVHTTRS